MPKSHAESGCSNYRCCDWEEHGHALVGEISGRQFKLLKVKERLWDGLSEVHGQGFCGQAGTLERILFS
jgi:hypothetical protein